MFLRFLMQTLQCAENMKNPTSKVGYLSKIAEIFSTAKKRLSLRRQLKIHVAF
jgi:hypothetical protein